MKTDEAFKVFNFIKNKYGNFFLFGQTEEPNMGFC